VQYIIGLALMSAASLSVQLLAVVLVILTRARPKALLWAFWLSALIFNSAIGIVILLVFRSKGTILGATTVGVHPAVYILVGVLAVAVGLFAATRRGRELIGREIEKSQSKGKAAEADDSVAGRLRARADGVKAKAEGQLLRGSVLVAIVVGLVMGAVTPFQLAAVGAMVRDDYSLPVQLLLVVGFSLVTYVVVEVPVLLYAVRPDATAARVAAFAAWLDANKIQVVAGIAAVVGVALIIKGVTSL
jgi:hypothetical protein